MAIRAKTKRRLYILLSLVLVAGVVIGTFVGIRRWQITRQVAQWRRQGMAAYDAGDYVAAINNLGMCLMRQESNATDIELIYRYAESRRKVEEPDGGHIRQAILWFRRLLVLKPDYHEAEFTLLDLYGKAGFASEANALADQILARDANNVAALRAKALACSLLHTTPRLKEALAAAEKVTTLAPLDLEMHLLVDSLMLGLNRPPADVVARAKLLQEKNPDEPRFLLLRAVTCRLTGDAVEAQKWALASADKPSPDAFYALTLVRVLDSLDLFDRSMTVLEKAAPAFSSSEIERALVRRLWETNRFQDVVTRVLPESAATSAPAATMAAAPAAATSLQTTHSEILAVTALSLVQLHRAAEAEPILTILAARTKDALAQAWLPALRQAIGRETAEPATLITLYTQGIANDSRNAQLRFFLGEVYVSLGERELAVRLWDEAAALEPAWPAPQIAISRLLASLGRVDQALDRARYTLKRFPHSVAAAITLAGVWASQLERDNTKGDSADLQQLITEIQRVIPDEPETLVLKIMMLARSDKTSEAASALKAAMQSPKPLSQDTLLRLSAVSRQYNLQLEDECLAVAEKLNGLTPELALIRAAALANVGKTADGLTLIEKAKPAGFASYTWDLARARYLELNADPRAKDNWVALTNQWPKETQVQRIALESPSVQADLPLIERLAERLHSLTGDQGVSWRLAKARLLLKPSASPTEISDATKILQETLGTAPESQVARLLLASALERVGNTRGAVEQLERAAQADPKSVRLCLELARIQQAQGNFDKAQEQIDKAVANPAASVYEQRIAAQLLAVQGQSDWAIRLLEGAGNKDSNLAADMLLARLYYQRGQLNKTADICKRLLESHDQASAIPFVAGLYAAMGKNDLAKEALDRLDKLELKPGMRELLLALHQAGRGDLDAAISFCRQGLEKSPALPSLWRVLILASVRQGKLAEAVDAAGQAAKAFPDETAFTAFVGAAPTMLAIGNGPAFRPIESAFLENASQMKPALDAMQLLVELKAHSDATAPVLAKFKTLADAHPRFLQLQLLVYNLYASTGRTEDAIAIATRTAQTFPADEQAARFAAEALAAAGQWVEVAPAAAEWHRRAGQETLAPDLLAAQAYLKQHDGKSALTTLEPYLEAARKDPANHVNVLALYSAGLVTSNQIPQTADLLSPYLPTVPAIRAVWASLAANNLPKPDAEAWLNRIAPLMAVDSWPDQLALADAWYRLASRFKDDSYKPNAEKVLAAAGAHCKPDPQSLLAAASLLDNANNLPAAAEAYDKVLQLQLKPDDPIASVARNNLAMVLVRSKTDLDRALKLAQEVAAGNPQDPNMLDTLASVYIARDEPDNALTAIRKAIQLAPNQPDWRLRETEILADASNLSEARKSLKVLTSLIANPQQLRPDLRDRLEAVQKKLG